MPVTWLPVNTWMRGSDSTSMMVWRSKACGSEPIFADMDMAQVAAQLGLALDQDKRHSPGERSKARLSYPPTRRRSPALSGRRRTYCG